MSDLKKYYIGIDLGNTYTGLAYIENSAPNNIKFVRPRSDNSEPKDHSIVAYDEIQKKYLFGTEALNRVDQGLKVYYEFKKHMGINALTVYGSKALTPIDCQAELLKHYFELFKNEAGVGNKYEIERIVISHPCEFNEAAKQDTLEAAKRAGFPMDKVGLINEPIAGAIHVTMEKNFHNKPNIKLFVFDFGGGTLDLTLIEKKIGNNVDGDLYSPTFTDGDRNLGGKDFDKALLNYCLSKIKKTNNIDYKYNDYEYRDPLQLKQLILMETAKKALNVLSKDKCEFVFNVSSEKKEIIDLTKEEAENVYEYSGLIDKVKNCLKTFFEELDDRYMIEKEEIDFAIMIGGTSLLTPVIKCVKQEFSDTYTTVIDPQSLNNFSVDAVMKGAALYAYNPDILTGTLSGASYGEIMGSHYEDGDPEELCFIDDNKEKMCLKNIIRIKKGDSISFDEPYEYSVLTAYNDQKACLIRITEGDGKYPPPYSKDCRIVSEFKLNLKKTVKANTEIKVEWAFRKTDNKFVVRYYDPTDNNNVKEVECKWETLKM